MPVREEVNYIAVHDEMPEHPKVEKLSDAAFRALVELWCYCSRRLSDGYIDEALWHRRATPKVRGELEAAGLVVPVPGVGKYEAHDYLDMQRSAAEAAALRAKRSEAAKVGNHRRHHVAKGIVAPDCPYCLKGVA